MLIALDEQEADPINCSRHQLVQSGARSAHQGDLRAQKVQESSSDKKRRPEGTHSPRPSPLACFSKPAQTIPS